MRPIFLCLTLLIQSVAHYCTINSHNGHPTCHSGINNADISSTNTQLSPSSIKSLSTKLYKLRSQKRSQLEMEHTARLVVAVENVHVASCTPKLMAPFCAELSLQLCALQRETHQYKSAVVSCKQGVEMAKIASMQQKKAWKHGDEFAAVRMRSKAALARAYGDVFEYDKALNVMKEIHSSFGADVPNAARFVLMDLHSEILMCSGEVHMSLIMYEKAYGKRSHQKRSISNLRRHVELLDASLHARPPPPLNVARAMQERRQHTVNLLLQTGKWDNKHQLPHHYISGLINLGPFPVWNKVDEEIRTMRELLQKYAVQLTVEIETLIQLGTREEEGAVLERDRECVHSKITESKRNGVWLRYSPTGYWHGDRLGTKNEKNEKMKKRTEIEKEIEMEKDSVKENVKEKEKEIEIEREKESFSCTKETTPIACKLLKELKNVGAKDRIVRIGYSVISSNTWIRPHYGRTNGQLKLHLGLIVPDNRNGNGGKYKCPADIRVGGETKEWKQNQVLLFDDSWEHEVYNGCDTNRAVLQVVVRRNI